MTIKQPYGNIFLQLKDFILKEINSMINKLPQSIPCRVIKNNGQTVNVQLTVSTGVTNQTINKIPIAKSKYFNIPFAAGDRGLLIPSSYIYDDLVLTGLGFISNSKKSTSRSGYVFVPFTNFAEDYAGVSVNNNTKIFSQDGNADIEITNTDIKFKTNEEILWSNLKIFLDAFKLSYNTNVTTENANLVSIQAQLTALGKPATITPLSSFTGDYR